MRTEPTLEELEKLIRHFKDTGRHHELKEVLSRFHIKEKDEVMDVIDDDTNEFHEEAIVINKLAWREGLVKKIHHPFKRLIQLFQNKWYLRFALSWALLFLFIYSLINAPLIYSRLQNPSSDDSQEAVIEKELVGGYIEGSAPLAEGEKIPNGNYLKIPKINVYAPIIFPSSRDEKVIQGNLQKGVVHYYGTANPGELGRVFITGHSSNFWWIKSKYNFVFVNLDKLQKGDQAVIYYKGKKYLYELTDKKVVSPENVSVLAQTEKPTLTLMTCTPPGTDWKRLIVNFDQIAPKYVQPRVVTREVSADKLPATDKNSLGGFLSSAWKEIKNIFKN